MKQINQYFKFKPLFNILILTFLITFQLLLFTSSPLVFGSPISEENPKGIRLNIPDDPRSNIALSWYTFSDTESMVLYGTSSGSLNLTVNSLENVEKIKDTYIHHVVLSNLDPNTTYFYKVGGSTSGWSGEYNFTTAPERNSSSLHFIAYGDNRSNRDLRRLVNRLVIQNMSTYHTEPVRFIMNMGDLVSSGDEHELFNYFFDDCEMLFQTIPILPIQGNHEFGDLGLSYYREQFVLPENGNDEWYWAIQNGMAFILGLDSESHGIVPYDSQNVPWIDSMLKFANNQSTVLWKFAYFHQPPFVSSSHMPRTDIRESWSPVFDNDGVDIVFNGHCHLYERSFPVSSNGSLPTDELYDYQNPINPIYIVTGAAGKGGPIDRLVERENDYMVKSNFTWHYVDIFISNNYTTNKTSLSAKVIGIIPQYLANGSVDEFDLSRTVLLDNFTITKDIPDSWFDTYLPTNYTDVLNLKRQKIVGYTFVGLVLLSLVGLDLWIIRRRIRFTKA
ncbi:MAG: purple acid phosphatase family protein [Promethearchaeota archaeon]